MELVGVLPRLEVVLLRHWRRTRLARLRFLHADTGETVTELGSVQGLQGNEKQPREEDLEPPGEGKEATCTLFQTKAGAMQRDVGCSWKGGSITSCQCVPVGSEKDGRRMEETWARRQDTGRRGERKVCGREWSRRKN
eukprot:scaffold867_cov317-Pavlova_lutheri.AAC.15